MNSMSRFTCTYSMNKDVINLIKDSVSTALNIAQMTQYRIEYVKNGGKEAEG